MFKMSIQVIGVSKYDFTNDSGEHVSGCKVNILYNSTNDNKIGAGITSINFPVEKFNLFSAVQKFPVMCQVQFDVEDFNKKVIVKDIILNN